MKREDLNNEKQVIKEVETTQPVNGLTVTTYTDNTTEIKVSEELEKSMIESINHFDKNVEKCGLCEFIAKKINCDFYSKHPITGRTTGHVKIGLRYLDLDGLRKLFNVAKDPDTDTDTDTDTAKKTRKKREKDTRTRVEKLEAARDWFIKSIEDITITKFEDVATLDSVYNKAVEIATEQDQKTTVCAMTIGNIQNADETTQNAAMVQILKSQGLSAEQIEDMLKQVAAIKQPAK